MLSNARKRLFPADFVRCANRTIDLRSDTGTTPSESMLRAMTTVQAGDDARGECSVTKSLEERVAELTGKDAALFLPTCTMANNVVFLQHEATFGRRGVPYVACGENSHIGNSEDFLQKGICSTPYAMPINTHGVPDLDSTFSALESGITLLCLENTSWATGAAFSSMSDLLKPVASKFRVHLDGARLWNAEVALGKPMRDLCGGVDSVALCFSKGLSAPGGAVICSDEGSIAEMRAWRRTLGGAMRQMTGQIAACAMVAMDERTQRLRYDHAKTQNLRSGLSAFGSILNDALFANGLATNVLLWKPSGNASVADVAACLAESGIKTRSGSDSIRFMVHSNVTEEDVQFVVAKCREIVTSE